MSQPKEIFKNILEKYLVEHLEKYDFIFNERSLKFVRDFGDIKNEIYFPAAKYNHGNEILCFGCYFVIESPKFKKWHKKNFPSLAVAHYLDPENNYNDKFKTDLYETHYNFVKYEHNKIMDIIIENFENCANPYFLDNNTWEKIAKNSTNENKVDALIMAEKYNDALEYCSSLISRDTNYIESEILKNETNSNIIEQYNHYIGRLSEKEAFLKKTCC